ncbi:cation:dicarboxylate symporter family transporter [Thalassotalea agarivorans]|uniref:Amino acid ABC transporter substrate-binding protein, PAAT family n=1 Tax=Thalassotalea agarivorans TaxID=349064 RepID=A0A1I0GP96_THASX|nr:cation:dicarboxylase symporter family transporter [Thalassotalea agarivorans]SET72087.1 amino acid ABC transporter substrate-binding protein, PAAT family [Thalassotalea agarivorans]
MAFKKLKMSMSTLILLSFAIGIVVGLFFGEMVAWMAIIGDAFIKLLQMTIIPYILVSLISSLGRLSHQQARSLGVQVGKLMLVIWFFGLLFIYLIKFTFPVWEAGDFFNLKTLEAPPTVNLLDLYIPSNPFFSLSNSYIPAIVLFCVATGIALISMDKKEILLEPMQLLGEAFNKVTQYIVKLMPLGIFAMTASTAGTMDIGEFEKLQVYFVAHIIMTVILTYWLLPAILAAFTPFSYRDITTIARDALITAFAAGNIFIILPLLIERTKELFHKYDIGDKSTDDYANIIIPIVFSFPNLGKLLTIVFVLFAGWFAGRDVDFVGYIPMAINGLISLFGSVYLTVPMLLDSLELPADLFQLYMVSSLFTSRFTSLLAAMNIFVLAVGGTAILTGRAKFNAKRLLAYSLLTPVVVGGILVATTVTLNRFIDTEYVMDEVIAQMSTAKDLPEEVRTYHLDTNTEPTPPRNIAAIQKSGVLRVGYNPKQVPFSYFNQNGKLVGFDVDMMEQLASEIGVKIAFIPYRISQASTAMNRGEFDIAVSGLQMTTSSIQRLMYTDPVLELHYSVVVKDHRVQEFSNEKNILDHREVRLAAVGDYSIIPQLKKRYPNLVVENIDSDRTFFEDDGKTWDGLLISLEAGKAWTILYPGYTTLFNREKIKSYPASYAVAKRNESLHTFLNNWLTIQHASGFVNELYSYWILGENAVPKGSRWSIIKDVLGWVEDDKSSAKKNNDP